MKYDVTVIGSGPGGYVAAIRAAQLGFKTALIEKAELGGICLNWGCIPTKALLKSAQVLDYVKKAEQFGIEVGKPEANFAAVIERSRKIADKMRSGVQMLLRKNKVEVIKGTASFINEHDLKVDDGEKVEKISSKNIIIATGARSKQLEGLTQDGTKIIGYREALNLPKCPTSMTIIGAGAIGVEMAYFYNAMGTNVTLIEYAPRIVPTEDHEISELLERSLKQRGIKIMTKTAFRKASRGKVVVERDGKEETIATEIILSAIGITPNIESLNLEKIGVKLEKGRIAVNKHYRTNISSVYAIGDVINTPALAHVASAEAINCIEGLKTADVPEINYEQIPSCIYTSPEIASVGLTEEAARASGIQVKIGKFPFIASGKAVAAGQTEGFVKIIYEATYGELLGCHIIGGNATDMIAEILVAQKLEATYEEVLRTIHPHPTFSEAIMEATAQAYGECIHL